MLPFCQNGTDDENDQKAQGDKQDENHNLHFLSSPPAFEPASIQTHHMLPRPTRGVKPLPGNRPPTYRSRRAPPGSRFRRHDPAPIAPPPHLPRPPLSALLPPTTATHP